LTLRENMRLRCKATGRIASQRSTIPPPPPSASTQPAAFVPASPIFSTRLTPWRETSAFPAEENRLAAPAWRDYGLVHGYHFRQSPDRGEQASRAAQ
jgi:hypothetical protein